MIVSVGLMEGLPWVEVELAGTFVDAAGVRLGSGRHRFDAEVTLAPVDLASCEFAFDAVTIGIGFHWERTERQVFRGSLRLLRRPAGLTVVNELPLEEYVASVISSEMSATCPVELLKAHAVIARSWLKGPAAAGVASPHGVPEGEVLRWYGREAHPDFEVCADDHCQRYQGITKAVSPAVAEAVRATDGEMLLSGGAICDARYSKCCGGLTEAFATAWNDAEIPYLVSFPDGPVGPVPADLEAFIRSSPPAFCNTADAGLLDRILPGLRPGDAGLLPLERLVRAGGAGRARRLASRRRSRADRGARAARARPVGADLAPEDRGRARRARRRQGARDPALLSHGPTSTARRSSSTGTPRAASS